MIALLALALAALAVAGTGVVVAVRDDQRDAFGCRRPLHRKCPFCVGAR